MSKNKNRNSSQKRKLRAQLFGGHTTKPCCFCRRILTFSSATLEHVVPLSRGGKWNKDNLRLSCYDCNQERGSEIFELYQRKKRTTVNPQPEPTVKDETITEQIKDALYRGALELKNDCEGFNDAMGYLSELCSDIDSDLKLGFEADDGKERELREAAKLAIHKAYA